MEFVQDSKANLRADKADWEADKAQQEEELKKDREAAAKAASALKADKRPPGSDKAALASAKSDLAKGELARLTLYSMYDWSPLFDPHTNLKTTYITLCQASNWVVNAQLLLQLICIMHRTTDETQTHTAFSHLAWLTPI